MTPAIEVWIDRQKILHSAPVNAEAADVLPRVALAADALRKGQKCQMFYLADRPGNVELLRNFLANTGHIIG